MYMRNILSHTKSRKNLRLIKQSREFLKEVLYMWKKKLIFVSPLLFQQSKRNDESSDGIPQQSPSLQREKTKRREDIDTNPDFSWEGQKIVRNEKKFAEISDSSGSVLTYL